MAGLCFCSGHVLFLDNCRHSVTWIEAERATAGGSLVSLKKTRFVLPSISFYLLQPHSWSANAGHLCASAAVPGGLFNGHRCLHRVPDTEHCASGASAV